jgi:hypothetical protein
MLSFKTSRLIKINNNYFRAYMNGHQHMVILLLDFVQINVPMSLFYKQVQFPHEALYVLAQYMAIQLLFQQGNKSILVYLSCCLPISAFESSFLKISKLIFN